VASFSDPSKDTAGDSPQLLLSALSDTFDTIGTFIGTGRKSGIFDDKDEAALFQRKRDLSQKWIRPSLQTPQLHR
jgi:AGZA family xanthine/uracil permease-like MFS transporter